MKLTCSFFLLTFPFFGPGFVTGTAEDVFWAGEEARWRFLVGLRFFFLATIDWVESDLSSEVTWFDVPLF
jgi:hypothetical protein